LTVINIGYTLRISNIEPGRVNMAQTKIFKSNQSQAVRLPKAVAFPEGVREVQIVSVGNSRIISPVNETWDIWFDGPSVSDDFMMEHNQPTPQDRESFDA